MDKWEKAHRSNTNKYARQIDAIYQSAVREAAAIGATIHNFSPDKPFSFADYPNTRDRVQKLINGLKSGVQTVILNGVDAEWTLANNKNNELCNVVFGRNASKLSEAQQRRYYRSNGAACDAFKTRKTAGLNLSDRVWRYTDQFKSEIEMGIDLGLRDGLSAADMTKELRQYLKYPDKLFRRVRDEHGNLQLSKNAVAFHPRQGVYRSSYKNARRLAATETNMAYRTSDHLRWQQADYVVGIRVVLSNNHTLLGQDGKPHEFTDICDELSAPLDFTPDSKKGLYPKDFKFVGWHPHCRCHALSVLKTPEEMQEDTKRILAGEETTNESVNKVTEVPQEFKSWIADNEDRMMSAKSIPYFLSDNPQYTGVTPLWAKTPKERAAARHAARTADEIRRIQDLADTRKYGKAYVDTIHEIENELGMKRGKRMTHSEANEGKVNPKYGKKGYDINCSTCTATYYMRRLGFDVTAKASIKANQHVIELSRGYTTWEKWKGGRTMYHSTKAWMNANSLTNMDTNAYREFINAFTKEDGLYEFNVGYKGGRGHSTILLREKGVIYRIEQQIKKVKKQSLDPLLAGLEKNPHEVRGIYRIDNAEFNKLYADIFEKPKKKKK